MFSPKLTGVEVGRLQTALNLNLTKKVGLDRTLMKRRTTRPQAPPPKKIDNLTIKNKKYLTDYTTHNPPAPPVLPHIPSVIIYHWPIDRTQDGKRKV